MPTTIIVFPPESGGNHLKNIISNYKDNKLYNDVTVHSDIGHNLQKHQVLHALKFPETNNILHGHFGEIMSFQDEIRSITDKKFILICLDTYNDHRMLAKRRKTINSSTHVPGDYFEGEQVFLYEPFMYHYYFNIPMENIMNISVSEFFNEDIVPVINRINFFLNNNIDVDNAKELHNKWYRNNIK